MMMTFSDHPEASAWPLLLLHFSCLLSPCFPSMLCLLWQERALIEGWQAADDGDSSEDCMSVCSHQSFIACQQSFCPVSLGKSAKLTSHNAHLTFLCIFHTKCQSTKLVVRFVGTATKLALLQTVWLVGFGWLHSLLATGKLLPQRARDAWR
jgi:hypothetical protein